MSLDASITRKGDRCAALAAVLHGGIQFPCKGEGRAPSDYGIKFIPPIISRHEFVSNSKEERLIKFNTIFHHFPTRVLFKINFEGD